VCGIRALSRALVYAFEAGASRWCSECAGLHFSQDAKPKTSARLSFKFAWEGCSGSRSSPRSPDRLLDHPTL